MSRSAAPQWLEAPWPAPPGVRALSTLRAGGLSGAPYCGLNLGAHVEDDPDVVAANRHALRVALGLPTEPVWLRQVHGVAVANLDAAQGSTPPLADAAVSRGAAVCAILTADCLPVLFASQGGEVVGAAHAGWRGLAAGVLEATVAALRQAPDTLLVWLAPAIGPAHFEVGPEVREAFLQSDPAAGAAFSENVRGRYQADLYRLAARRLIRLGIERIYRSELCTYADTKRFFSHRRDGRTGRQATLIWRADR